jgi:pilus assembly protein CpaE
MDSAEVLLLTTDTETTRTVQKTVGSASVGATAEVCKSVVELRSRVTKPGAAKIRRIAIVDIDANPHQMLHELTKTVTMNPSVMFVVVSQEFTERLVLQAMQAGARHFLRKGTIETELIPVLDRLLLHGSHERARLGNIVTVFSCSGGCGATTVAVNLAAELRETPEQTALLIDLDPHYGSVAHYLNLTGKYGIAHILDRDGMVDRHLIESSVVPVDERLDALLSPAAASADAGVPVNYANLLKTLDACRETHDYVVVDAPRLPPQAMADLAAATSVAVVVLQLTVRDVAFAGRLIPALIDHGMAPERILALANQRGRRGPLLKPAEVEKVLKPTPLLCVRSDVKKAIRSINRGLAMAHFARRSGLRRDFSRIAAQVQKWTTNGHANKGGR